MRSSSYPRESTVETAECAYYTAGQCHSCQLLASPPHTRLSIKLTSLQETLATLELRPHELRDPVTLRNPWSSRHKVKMSVSGSTKTPILGITRRDLSTQDLKNCCLSAENIRQLLHYISKAITTYALSPYNVLTRSGELKHIIIMTTSNHDQGILRFVLHTHKSVATIRSLGPKIQGEFPWVRVISCNIQPIPAAIIEGPEEIVVTDTKVVHEQWGSLHLYFSPQSFMQVTPAIARKLYERASDIISTIKPMLTLDLYCGVGGFSLSAAAHSKKVIGVEISQEAIQSAQRSAEHMKLDHVTFVADDAERFIESNPSLCPDLVITNPPRRGLSDSIIMQLQRMAPLHILYSSCNPQTFARDASQLSSNYDLLEVTPFDMFPMTKHWEILGLFRRK